MKSDLEELIEAYEMEKAELEKQISEYVSEGDYLYAHQYQKGLRKLCSRLAILKELQNPLYKSISEEEATATNIRRLFANNKNAKQNDYLTEYLNKIENKILELKHTAVQPGYDSQEVDDALFFLVDGTVKGFKLYFKTFPEVFVNFALADHAIEIKLQYDAMAVEEYSFIFRNVNQFKSLGFQLRDTQWIYYYSLDKFKDALEIKIMLARLIYDVFHYDRRYDSARIVYE
jgi:hypothetical protein